MNPDSITRRSFLQTTAAVGSLATLSPPTSDLSGVLGWSPPDDVSQHSGNRLPWIVHLEDDVDLESEDNPLSNWISGETDRELVASNAATNRATLLATPGEIGVRNRDQLLGSGMLKDYDWIESIELNRTRSLAEPVEPADSSAWSSLSSVQSAYLWAFANGAPSSSMVAFDSDMEETRMQASRRVTGALASDLNEYDLEYPSGADTTVAVVDTGVNDGTVFDPADPDAEDAPESRILPESKNIITDETGRDAVADGDGHGTWVVACVGANADDPADDGYLPDVRLLGVKALDDEGAGATDDIADGITYAAEQGADVICMSLGSIVFSETIERAVEYATDLGSVPIAATGNDRQVTRWLATPASSDHTLAIGATTADDPEDALSAYYSNIGPHDGLIDNSAGETAEAMPDFAAPGCQITVPTPNTRGRVEMTTLTGTSMAAPHVAGIAAMLVAHEPSLEYDEVRDRLARTASPVPNAAVEEVGAGMPHAARALADVESEDDQADVMTTEAENRGLAYDHLSQYPLSQAAAALSSWF